MADILQDLEAVLGNQGPAWDPTYADDGRGPDGGGPEDAHEPWNWTDHAWQQAHPHPPGIAPFNQTYQMPMLPPVPPMWPWMGPPPLAGQPPGPPGGIPAAAAIPGSHPPPAPDPMLAQANQNIIESSSLISKLLSFLTDGSQFHSLSFAFLYHSS